MRGNNGKCKITGSESKKSKKNYQKPVLKKYRAPKRTIGLYSSP